MWRMSKNHKRACYSIVLCVSVSLYFVYLYKYTTSIELFHFHSSKSIFKEKPVVLKFKAKPLLALKNRALFTHFFQAYLRMKNYKRWIYHYNSATKGFQNSSLWKSLQMSHILCLKSGVFPTELWKGFSPKFVLVIQIKNFKDFQTFLAIQLLPLIV